MSDAMVSMTTPNGFQFSAVPIDDNLDALEYAIGEILIDASGSISGYEKQIVQIIVPRYSNSCCINRNRCLGSHY